MSGNGDGHGNDPYDDFDVPPPSEDYQEAHGWRDGKPSPETERAKAKPNGKYHGPEPEGADKDEVQLDQIFEWSEDAWDIAAIPRRPWVAPPYLMRRQITLLHGPGGASKSLITVYWAIALVLGRPFGRLDPIGPKRVLLANFEDDEDEQKRRISAALDYFGATPADLAGKLRRVYLGKKSDATMFTLSLLGQVTTTTPWEAFLWHCKTFRPDVVSLDPFIAVNAAGESNNEAMRRVMTIFRTSMLMPFECAFLLAHHDVKGSDDDTASETASARGAGDITNAVRFELAVRRMTSSQAESFGIEPDKRTPFFRLGSEDSKRNYAAPAAAEWFERDERDINEEMVVICRPWEPPDGRLDPDQAAAIEADIAKGWSNGKETMPWSPLLGDNTRSVAALLERHGLITRATQRQALRQLMRKHGVTKAPFRRPGHGTNERNGLRTANGDPHNFEWKDQDMEAGG
jgi:hypothetical protein